MKVTIINCFDTYEERVDLVHEFFVKKGYEVNVLQSNYRHFKKETRTELKKNFIFIKTMPYQKNLSFSRMYSHYNFSKKIFKKIGTLEQDVLYVLLPPNFLAKYMRRYKKSNEDVKLIFDIIDLWPETMPVDKMKTILPFSLWAQLRNNSLKFADFVITECDLYQNILRKYLNKENTKTVYLAKKSIDVVSNVEIETNKIELAYLGSINNIIDIDLIVKIIKKINKKKIVTLNIIGDGESKDELVERVLATGARVQDHGKVYDPQKKQAILDKCSYGINVMKKTVCVGLTMKSIDYLQHGLPLINNIPSDTDKLVEENKIGFNLKLDNIDDLVGKILNTNHNELINMRINSYEVFRKYFSDTAFFEKLYSIEKQIVTND